MSTTVVWFRRDLRLTDNAALTGASGQVVPLFVKDPKVWDRVGSRRRQRIAASLADLDSGIRRLGGPGIVMRTGDPAAVVARVAEEAQADFVRYAPDVSAYAQQRDRRVDHVLRGAGCRLVAGDSPFLHAPGTIQRGDGGPYSVFTPFHRAWIDLPVPEPVESGPLSWAAALPSEAWPLESSGLPGAGGRCGEASARADLAQFIDHGLPAYGLDRNRPDLPGTSRLSQALHFGELHPRTVIAEIRRSAPTLGADFVRQLAWRDFYGHILSRLPSAGWANVDRRFDRLPWSTGPVADARFEAWTSGQTGYPMVDAGMRQLADEGWMHNRVRMIVASFLTKDLLLPWQRGAAWFSAQLLDADTANNALGWQWVAGTGMDPAPFHRVFNPVLQGRRFDPDGSYVRRYVPELAHLPGLTVHEPWTVPAGYDRGYPPPLVEHAEARAAALAAYRATARPG